MSNWPRKFRTFWCVVDSRGTAYLVSARGNRSRSIAAFVNDAGKSKWSWWYRVGYRCRRVDIKCRRALEQSQSQEGK